MTSAISTAVLALAWFAAVNGVASMAAAAMSRYFADSVSARGGRARQLLMVRFLPASCALIISFALFVPAHLALEPVNADERYGAVPLALVAAGLGLLGYSALKLARLALTSLRFAVHVRHLPGSPMARFVEVPVLQGIALAGVVRPRVLVGTRARLVLTKEELDVAIAHELAHRSAWDNFARVLILCTPDFFAFTAAARRIERLWEAEAECLADARAVAGDAGRAATLASALVKVARLAAGNGNSAYAPGWSTFHHAALLETRVRLLVRDDLASDHRSHLFLIPLLCAVTAIAFAWAIGIPRALHQVTEIVLAVMP